GRRAGHVPAALGLRRGLQQGGVLPEAGRDQRRGRDGLRLSPHHGDEARRGGGDELREDQGRGARVLRRGPAPVDPGQGAQGGQDRDRPALREEDQPRKTRKTRKKTTRQEEASPSRSPICLCLPFVSFVSFVVRSSGDRMPPRSASRGVEPCRAWTSPTS